IDWAVNGLIAMAEVALVNAQAGAGKTAFLTRLMQGVAAGETVLNFTVTRPRRVLYAMLERGPRSLQRRVRRAFEDTQIKNVELLCQNFRAVALAGETLRLIVYKDQQWLPNYEAIGQLTNTITRLGIEV